ncbi:MAG: anaerobic ribonucleoside-triphosphate reductase activating protein [Clostridiaceae bacterium]|nr:MAG: anaerobic ribonucleoside-triphosphate reductase activating protein [Clostridiaceae bacterium]
MKYASIKKMDISNGEGIRVSLFVSGCNFHCPGCFNEEAQSFDYGKNYIQATEDLILKEVSKPHIKGLSLLGGDPLWQDIDGLKQLRQLVQKVHDLGKTVWIWSGFTYENLLDGNGLSEEANERILLVCDCDVFVDGLFEYDKKDLSLAWRGSRNQRVIDMNKTKDKVVLYCE